MEPVLVQNDPVNLNDPSGLMPGWLQWLFGSPEEAQQPDLSNLDQLRRMQYLMCLSTLAQPRPGYDLMDVAQRRDEAQRLPPDAAKVAKTALANQECNDLFHGPDATQYGDLKFKLFSPGNEAAAETGRKWWKPWEVRIDISLREDENYWLGADDGGRPFILLHELGYVYNLLFNGSEIRHNDTGGSAEAKADREYNTTLLSEKCIERGT